MCKFTITCQVKKGGTNGLHEADCKKDREENRQEDGEKEVRIAVITEGGFNAPFNFMQVVYQRFLGHPLLDNLIFLLKPDLPLRITTLPPAVQILLAGFFAYRLERVVVLIVPAEPDSAVLTSDARVIFPELPVLHFRSDDPAVLSRLPVLHGPALLIASEPALEAPAPEWNFQDCQRQIERGDELNFEMLIGWLEDHGFERVDMVTEPGEYASRGGIIDVFPDDAPLPVRLELADNTLVSLRTFDPLTQRSCQQLERIVLNARQVKLFTPQPSATLLPTGALFIGGERVTAVRPQVVMVGQVPDAVDLGYLPAPVYCGNFRLLRQDIAVGNRHWTIVAVSEHHRQRLERLLGEGPDYFVGELSSGFTSEGQRWTVLTERELYGTPVRRRHRRRFRGVPVDNLLTLKPGDYVVHIDYGIGRFTGVRRMDSGGGEKDYLVLEYEDNARVYVPVDNLGLIDRYIGSDDSPPQLDRLGSMGWLRAKVRAERASAEYAQTLLDNRARRLLVRSEPLPVDPGLLAELEASFPYEETPDQLQAMEAIREDLTRGQPMDRLVCGDVGFGKTEIALRAAFQVAINCRQVAFLVPTTVLCYQHWRTFRSRLERFPLRIEMLSRFTPRSQQQEIVRGLKLGLVDIVVGTHQLLAPGIQFKNLGLLIVDEEHRFGVRQKERLRQFRADVNVLTLSATPIPRTLYMALSRLIDISPIHTPPPGRREVRTEIAEWDDELIRIYVYRELNRQGQIFFVHNEIETLNQIERRLRRILPDIQLRVAHGRMTGRKLADIYLDFAAGKFPLLLSTAIIESGLDLPNVNTLIVNGAEWFGLADLHQLRGRVGRSTEQAYALFLVSSRWGLTPSARQRLGALLAYSEPGAGYRLAMRDLEIRGFGNLLGTEQHGHVARIGLNLYQRLLSAALARLRGETLPVEPRLKLDITAYIPESYIPDGLQRLALYKRLLSLETLAELADLKAELLDRFGKYPAPVENLLQIAQVRLLCRQRQVLAVSMEVGGITLTLPEKSLTLNGGLTELLQFLRQFRG